MLVLFTGSRTWPAPAFVRDVMIQLRTIIGDFTAMHGGARGLDTFVDLAARTLNLPTPLVERPDYDRYPSYLAPKIRNTTMLDLRPDMVVGFRTSGASSGTDDCLYKTINIYRVPVLVYTGPLDRIVLPSPHKEKL